MQKYSLYFIEDEFFHHYYHKSTLLFDFFIHVRNQPSNSIIRKQYEFITKKIPYKKMKEFLAYHTNLTVHETEEGLLINHLQSNIVIECEDREWTVYASSLHEVERLLFENLRCFDISFYVVDFEHNQYGWLSPLRKEILL
ncbi:sporulation inhibitor of replication protein SirA [Salirhabdus sp. Marseille-P4669]|uniref:sporulation inhibitor of replication protein SirA n=1 Tax=Salirhabdus sp. Marseille-P4669 TaxID=2042310 RepID=UPI000C7CEC3F|nr:sporulation inhibitor of replication protein SirA [Salirhabdus sp. Marseille-P4669]